MRPVPLVCHSGQDLALCSLESVRTWIEEKMCLGECVTWNVPLVRLETTFVAEFKESFGYFLGKS
jgi:hypothetical protein